MKKNTAEIIPIDEHREDSSLHLDSPAYSSDGTESTDDMNVSPELRVLSWNTIEFLDRPSSKLFQWCVIVNSFIAAALLVAAFFVKIDVAVKGHGEIIPSSDVRDTTSGIDGYVSRIDHPQGSTVSKGDVIATISVPGKNPSTQTIAAPINGTLLRLNVRPDSHVTPGMIVAAILPAGTSWEGKIHVRSSDIAHVKPGQKVLFRLGAYPFERFGSFEGQILSFDPVDDKTSDHESEFIAHATITAPPNLRPELAEQIQFMIGLEFQANIINDRETIAELIQENLFGTK